MSVEKVPFYCSSKVKDAATGHWLEVFACLADNEMSEALLKAGKHVTCPIHGTSGKGKGDGFRLYNDVVDTGGGVCNTCGSFSDGFELLKWLKGWDFRTTLQAIAETLRVEPEQNPVSSVSTRFRKAKQSSASSVAQPLAESCVERGKPLTTPTPERLAEIKVIQTRLKNRVQKDSKASEEKIDRIWYESITLVDCVPAPLFKYWKRRGILLRKEMLTKGDSIRYHPALPYYEESDEGVVVCVGKFPAIIAAIRDLDGKIITLHRTYLNSLGKKAKVECPRKMMSIPADKILTGASIQLGGFPTSGVLGVSEGLETAMSAFRIYGIPTWSAVSASILEKFEPPKSVHTLLVWADKDKSLTGQRAAQSLKDVLEPKGIAVHVLIPQCPLKGKSVDWNDVLISEGSWGFPGRNFMKRFISGGAVCVS